MSGEADLQDLLRLLTSRKMSMMAAMAQVKALQNANLCSIQRIAEAGIDTVTKAINNEATAKSLQAACKSYLKKPTKRPADSGNGVGSMEDSKKRRRTGNSAMGTDSTPTGEGHAPTDESSLELPLCLDEALIASTTLYTNRAPLALAFAVELLKHTMPEQPPSSRLSLAQAVVSANSQSKAANLGIEKDLEKADSWATSQPKVKVMGREIPVLKRGGYVWTNKEDDSSGPPRETEAAATALAAPAGTNTGRPPLSIQSTGMATAISSWVSSEEISSRSSTFVAHAHPITTALSRPQLMDALFAVRPRLRTATHNAWAYRVAQALGGEASFDDGETGCGDFLLRRMRAAGASDVLVVVSRWFGGTLLGTDRWALMQRCADEALAGVGMRRGGDVQFEGEALWGLDVASMRKGLSLSGGGARSHQPVEGAAVHRPEAARSYLLRAFASYTPDEEDKGGNEGKEGMSGGWTGKRKTKRTGKRIDGQEEDAGVSSSNLGKLMGALRLLFESWKGQLPREALDSRAWSWYVAVRPDVEAGPAGWGAKGPLKLGRILDMRRKD